MHFLVGDDDLESAEDKIHKLVLQETGYFQGFGDFFFSIYKKPVTDIGPGATGRQCLAEGIDRKKVS